MKYIAAKPCKIRIFGADCVRNSRDSQPIRRIELMQRPSYTCPTHRGGNPNAASSRSGSPLLLPRLVMLRLRDPQDSLCQGPMGIASEHEYHPGAARWSVWKTYRARSRSPQGSGLRPRCAPLTALVAATVFPLWPASRLSLKTPSCSVSQYTHVSLHHAKQSPGVP